MWVGPGMSQSPCWGGRSEGREDVRAEAKVEEGRAAASTWKKGRSRARGAYRAGEAGARPPLPAPGGPALPMP